MWFSRFRHSKPQWEEGIHDELLAQNGRVHTLIIASLCMDYEDSPSHGLFNMLVSV